MKGKDLIETQRGVKEQSQSLIEREPIKDGGGIELIFEKDRGYFLAIGMHRLTEYYQSDVEPLKLLKDRSWNLIATLCWATVDSMMNFKKIEK